MNSSNLEEDCAVCQMKKAMKIKVPECTHSFCFHCIKGVLLNANEKGVQPACPICRTAFSEEFLTKHTAPISKYSFGDNPGAAEDEEVLEEKPDVQQLQAQMRAGGWDGVIAPNTPSTSQPQRPVDQAVYWLYGGAGGWWKYGESDRVLLEEKYLAGEPSADTWVMGFKYTIDFARMVQYRADDHYKMRAVKRCNREELRGTIVKGEAGILFAEVWNVE
ncbi:hypothetical protein CAEBREN_11245 [Caenorhabditis brenneri]|uniref:E3 ubiquitin-protein ligase n=1 Tax=Caenorhabditis brenneri TaxID=135651 RepID=G0MBN5_CAEBE|nr:hypothetical protein CAEBREN_11245 [Caenorhabditis brenneri]